MMLKFISNAALMIIFLIFPGCETESILSDDQNISPNDIQINQYGSEHSFDIATWNIEHFPKNQFHTVPHLVKIIQKIDIDLIAMQEIEENIPFYNMIDSLNGYHGYVSQLPENGQRLAIIFKSDIISISDPEQIFSNDDWAFPRPPLVSFVTVKKENKTMFDFILIVLHLKAFVDLESKKRRREACQKLKDYIDTYLLTGAEKDIIILGDFNDELDDPLKDNVFQMYLKDSLNYEFLTVSLADDPTYIGHFQSTIDHILITKNVKNEYVNGLTQVLKIDKEYPYYTDYISDHRPVLARFFIF